jgi:hypothetical protein
MDIVKILLEPQVMAALVIAVATSYLIGAVEGEHRASTSADAEDEGPGAAERRRTRS